MKYSIVWLQPAVDQLLALWLKDLDRSAITAAADEVDSTLANDPVLRGETLAGPFRILLIDPLQVVYRITPTSRIRLTILDSFDPTNRILRKTGSIPL